MALSPSEIESIFNDSFSKIIQEALIKCLFGAYKTAFDDCAAKFPKEEARDICPLYRWTQIRSDLRGLPARFSGVLATAERYHTRVTSGHIILTAHSVETSDELPRDAEYRREYACTSQLDMWGSTDSEFIYAILAHAPDPKDHRQPDFASILFPDKAYNGVVHSINLFRKFESLVSSLRIPLVEAEQIQPAVQPKKQIKTQNEGLQNQ